MSNNFSQFGTLSMQGKVKKAGPVFGSLTSIVGAVITLFGFMLPWASCGSIKLSGYDIATQNNPGGNSSAIFLLCIPALALAVMVTSAALIPASFWSKIPPLVKPIGAVLLVLFSCLACCPAGLFFANIQNTRNDPNAFGMGSLIQVETGYYLSVFGILLAIVGGAIAVGTAIWDRASLKSGERPSAPPPPAYPPPYR